jgi:CDP-glucose 4,6-dehydratase
MDERDGALEGLVSNRSDWNGRSVFVTGHTGFKGGWLALWLQQLGARVHGLALDPATEPSLFDTAGVAGGMTSDHRIDLADHGAVSAAIADAAPEILFHLAAQPLVRESYRDPVETFRTNVLGTVHVLEAARRCPSLRAVVVVTTDKVYRNDERAAPFAESETLGGADPYSASKAAAEIATESYRRSFFGGGKHGARVATARAGNVIGGGDWAAERLVPDCLRASDRGEDLTLRYPGAVRPWQHVLEPLSGYLALAEKLFGEDGADYAEAWNFGPDRSDDATVGAVAEQTLALLGNGVGIRSDGNDHPHEAAVLRLDSAKARDRLGWSPRWPLAKGLEKTVEWHRAWRDGADMRAVTLGQIAEYEAAR